MLESWQVLYTLPLYQVIMLPSCNVPMHAVLNNDNECSKYCAKIFYTIMFR